VRRRKRHTRIVPKIALAFAVAASVVPTASAYVANTGYTGWADGGSSLTVRPDDRAVRISQPSAGRTFVLPDDRAVRVSQPSGRGAAVLPDDRAVRISSPGDIGGHVLASDASGFNWSHPGVLAGFSLAFVGIVAAAILAVRTRLGRAHTLAA
jgi:hypothetical protein